MRKAQKNKFDEIGKALVKADRLSTRELENIIANPALFDSVRMRIASESPRFETRRSTLRPMIAAFASIAVIGAIAFAFVTLRTKTEVGAVKSPAPAPNPQVNKFNEPDHVVSKLPPVGSQTQTEKTAARPDIRSSRSRRPVAQQVRHEGDFYALSLAGDPNETERGGRIVRVDLPRSTLFAMGVDVPLENDNGTVKADLLVGPDGVTRAIRVVE